MKPCQDTLKLLPIEIVFLRYQYLPSFPPPPSLSLSLSLSLSHSLSLPPSLSLTTTLAHAIDLVQWYVDAHEVLEGVLTDWRRCTHREVAAIKAQSLTHLLEEHPVGHRPAKRPL